MSEHTCRRQRTSDSATKSRYGCCIRYFKCPVGRVSDAAWSREFTCAAVGSVRISHFLIWSYLCDLAWSSPARFRTSFVFQFVSASGGARQTHSDESEPLFSLARDSYANAALRLRIAAHLDEKIARASTLFVRSHALN